MKAASYILFALAGVACAVVAASFLASDVRARLSAWKHGGVVQQDVVVRGTDLPVGGPADGASGAASADDGRLAQALGQLESRLSQSESASAALSARVDDLERRLAALAASGAAVPPPAPVAPVARVVPVPPLLALRLPAAQFFAVDDRDLFGLSLFSGLRFTAYRDRQFEARWWFFDEDYASVKRNLAAASAFQVKETNSFFGKSSFVNAQPADGFVRIVFDLSGKAVAAEIVKERYEVLKKLLLK